MRFEFYRGKECPLDLLKLTLPTGLMQYWIKGERSMLRAYVVYDHDKIVGWCGYVFIARNKVKMGTFIAPEYRGKGLSRQLVRGAVEHIANSNRFCEVQYGGPLFNYFNSLYEQEIERVGLMPNCVYGPGRDVAW